METERVALSQRERDPLKVLHEAKQKHLSQVNEEFGTSFMALSAWNRSPLIRRR
jgi:hypothetical protein